MSLVGFGIIAACVLLAALFVVRSQNLVHATLWLGLTLVGTAALYAMLGASFLAGVQVLLYVGGVMTLMLFGVMLTRRHDGLVVQAERMPPLRGAVVAAGFFGVLAAAIAKSELPSTSAPSPVETAAVGAALFRDHVLAFEVLSVLLLAAIIGAVAIARRRDFVVESRARELGSSRAPSVEPVAAEPANAAKEST
ncbi:MAG: NADH-quinone oxidoreductase subunit J [Polyangiaceae bacterium]